MFKDGGSRKAAEAQAAAWVVRLGGDPLTHAEHERLATWLAERPQHSAAFDEARAAWTQLDLLRSAPGALALDDEPAARPTARSHAVLARRSVAAAGLTAALGLALGLGVFWFGDPTTMIRADHRTGVGEVRTVTLADGSRVDLAPSSAIAVRFDGRERRIELLSGAASFTAMPKATAGDRPFVVEAANGEARALGTRFIVDRGADAVRVTVAEHEVEISAAAPSGVARATLSPGRQVRYDATGLSAVSTVDPGQAESWRRGRLLFNAAPLSDVVAELNRYRRSRIIVADAALGRRRVSGAFDANDIDGALAAIVDELDAQAVTVGPFVTVIR